MPLLTARPTTQFNGALKRTPDGAYIVGVSEITNDFPASVVYVYSVAFRNVVADPDCGGAIQHVIHGAGQFEFYGWVHAI